jgi:two-component system LytT family sensor kinase
MNSVVPKKKSVLSQFLLWVGVWLFYIFFFSYHSAKVEYILLISTFLTLITAITSYAFETVFIPKYLSAKKYVWFGMYALFSLLMVVFCVLLLLMVMVAYIPDLRFEDLPPLSKNFMFMVTLVFLMVFLVNYAGLWENNQKALLENSELQKQLITARFKAKEQELNYLKNQIHPHFLFNSLNTIYGLALKKSTDTPDAILKLSSLLDYILYTANKPEVPLKDEINHIENYIALEKIRFRDTLKVTFSRELANEDLSIAPMLLLPFVENAFKHGKIVAGFLHIEMGITSTSKELGFTIKNTWEKQPTEEGIGLKNIRERLEILYPGCYDLRIDKNFDWFEVRLNLAGIMA